MPKTKCPQPTADLQASETDRTPPASNSIRWPLASSALAIALSLVSSLWLSSGAVRADTIVLKDGTVIDGEILTETRTVIRVRTDHGVRSYRKKNIERILKPTGDLSDLANDDFTSLPSEAQAILDARALYSLGDWQRVIELLTPLVAAPTTDSNKILMEWLIIQTNERLGRFSEAKQGLQAFIDHGGPRDLARATAHLQIFKDNPDFSLRLIGKTRARYFLARERELLIRGKESSALADQDLMDAALHEYCDQILLDEAVSVEAFRASLDVQETLRSLDRQPILGAVTKYLPYIDRLTKVETSHWMVQAISYGYGDAFELDLVRTEADHLLSVIEVLFEQLVANNPENFTPAFDNVTGRLTADGRREWRERCEEFIEDSQPALKLTEYLLEKLQRYPKELRRLNRIYTERFNRLKQMRQSANRRKEQRTHV